MWGFSFLSVTVISAFSLTGVFVVPLMKTRYMKYVLTFFIALAIGTLYSTAILQLLPEVCHPSTHLPVYTFYLYIFAHSYEPFLLLENTNAKGSLVSLQCHMAVCETCAPLVKHSWSVLFPLLPAFVFSRWFYRAVMRTVEGLLVSLYPVCIIDHLSGYLYLRALCVCICVCHLEIQASYEVFLGVMVQVSLLPLQHVEQQNKLHNSVSLPLFLGFGNHKFQFV